MSGGWGTPSWMGGDPVIGETFVGDKSPEMARDLLAAADEVGVDQGEVRTITGGFIVPDAVWETAQQNRVARDGLDF